MDNVIVLCVDRDNDLGRKTGIQGPVVGRENNIKAATKLIVKDPEEADANCMFAAVKKYDEVKKYYKNVEIATITGYGKSGFRSDKILNAQLDALMKNIKPEGFVLVTDGAEDDQIIPLLQSRGRIISKENVIIRQAHSVESAFFTISEALKDPFFSKIVFGIPGIVLLLLVALGTYGVQIITFVFGVYLLLKGFGIEERALSLFSGITKSISVQRASFPFYLGSLFIVAFAIVNGYTAFTKLTFENVLVDSVKTVQSAYIFIVLAAISVVFGKCIDVVHRKRAYRLRRYLVTVVSIIMFWIILETGTQVFLRQADFGLFLASVIGSFMVIVAVFRISAIVDVRERITKLLVGLPIYDSGGKWLGRVENIDKKKNSIVYVDGKTDSPIYVAKGKFTVRRGRLVLSSSA